VAVFNPPADYSHAEVVPGLYLGGFPPESPFRWGADVVVSLAATHACPVVPHGQLLIHHRIADDGEVTDPYMLRALAGLVAGFLAQGRCVFVHCNAGLDRSPMLCALVLIKWGWQPQAAIDHIRSFRLGALGDVPPGLWGKAGRGFAQWLLTEGAGPQV
jgi:hypothetical protein